MKCKKIWAAVAGVIWLSGCASGMNVGESKLSCSVAPGLPCTNIQQAWQKTDDYLPGEAPPGAAQAGRPPVTDTRGGRIADFVPQPIPNAATINEPKPLLMPAQVLRVWVNAYQDSGGNLIYPSRVFSEVTPRRWNVGNAAARGIDSARRVTPLTVIPPAEAVAQASTASDNLPLRSGTLNTTNEDQRGNPSSDALPTGVLPPLKSK